jgi:hypothetical protein
MVAEPVGPREVDYSVWPLRDRLELLAFEAELAGIPRRLIAALWEAIDEQETCRRTAREKSQKARAASLMLAAHRSAAIRIVHVTPFTVEFCGFPIEVVLSGKAKTIELPGGRTLMTAPGLTVTLTNPANGNQETLNITGAGHQRVLENGDVETVSTGRNALFAPAVPGLVLIIGRFSFVLDADGNLVQPLEGTGQLIDLCELLA